MDVSSALSYMLDVNTGLKVVGLASVFLVWWAVLEQIRLYRYGASKYPGPMFVIPFVNSVVEMVSGDVGYLEASFALCRMGGHFRLQWLWQSVRATAAT